MERVKGSNDRQLLMRTRADHANLDPGYVYVNTLHKKEESWMVKLSPSQALDVAKKLIDFVDGTIASPTGKG